MDSPSTCTGGPTPVLLRECESSDRRDVHRYYALPDRLRLNHWALAGELTIGQEKVALDRAGGSISYRFHARDAHLVLSAAGLGPIPFRLLLDGEAPGLSHGVDVDRRPPQAGPYTDWPAGACPASRPPIQYERRRPVVMPPDD